MYTKQKFWLANAAGQWITWASLSSIGSPCCKQAVQMACWRPLIRENTGHYTRNCDSKISFHWLQLLFHFNLSMISECSEDKEEWLFQQLAWTSYSQCFDSVAHSLVDAHTYSFCKCLKITKGGSFFFFFSLARASKNTGNLLPLRYTVCIRKVKAQQVFICNFDLWL